MEEFDLVVILHELQAEALRQNLLGQVVTGRSQAACRDDDIRTGFCDLHTGTEPFGVVPYYGVILDVDPDAGEHLGYIPGIGVGDMSQKNLRPDGDDFSIIRSHGSCLPIVFSPISYHIFHAFSTDFSSAQKNRCGKPQRFILTCFFSSDSSAYLLTRFFFGIRATTAPPERTATAAQSATLELSPVFGDL